MDPATYVFEAQSALAILVTASGRMGASGLVCGGLGLQFGRPASEGSAVGCHVGDDEVEDGAAELADTFG